MFLNKVTGLQACNFIEKELQHRCFRVKFTKFSRTSFFTEQVRWRLLKTIKMAIQNFLRKVRFYVVFYKIIDYNGTRQKINEKYITKKIIKKESRKYSTSTYLTALSNRTVKKESGEGGP